MSWGELSIDELSGSFIFSMIGHEANGTLIYYDEL